MMGPTGYENWKTSFGGDRPTETFEFQLYSDANISGHIAGGCGPYAFLNALGFRASGEHRHVATVRVQTWAVPMAGLDKTDSSRYHGGSLTDELSALASMLMGIRLKGGSVTRLFYDDTAGMPHCDEEAPAAALIRDSERLRIPSARRTRNLNEALIPRLLAYPQLMRQEAVALVRAARLYQDALWIAEAQPHLAWLLLVSAIEVMATEEQVTANVPEDLLALSMVELHAELTAAGGAALVSRIAPLLERLLRATARFLKFFEVYLPDPPERPSAEKSVLIEWTWPNLKKILSKVYDYRSRALHDGTPFPSPMWRLRVNPASIANARLDWRTVRVRPRGS